MIVADTSSLISLASIELIDTFLTEFDVHTSETVVAELEETSSYDDRHGKAADIVLNQIDRIQVHSTDSDLETSRIDLGEGSTAALANELDADFLITDDLQALPEIQQIVDAKVGISPIVLKSLVQRNVHEKEEALDKLDDLAEQRSWLGAPIYRRAKQLFQPDN
ncbi:MAG: hypothetical protein ABEK16_03325 [Candidatus Nanohalobium sp.]